MLMGPSKVQGHAKFIESSRVTSAVRTARGGLAVILMRESAVAATTTGCVATAISGVARLGPRFVDLEVAAA